MAFLALLGALTAVVAIVAGSALINGYILSILWGWFIVPTFDAPKLSIAAAIGIALVIGYLTHQETKTDDNADAGLRGFVVAMSKIILKPLIVLLFGWVVHLFM